MIRHHILWRYTEKAEEYGKEALIAELNRRFKGLIGKVEGLTSIEITASNVKADPGFHDVLLYAEFTDRAALAGYMLDEGHAEIRDWDQQYVCDRAGFDIEV
ncbi:MAG: Dabb family protein [Clostridia bacterium]|nr:Dabb family protein [Clostridia bacterium]